jgi:hypothetical protein
MAASFIQVALDSIGKKMQTFLNTLGTDDVHAEAVVNVNSSGVEIAPLTDTQLRATAVPVSGPVTDAQLRASAVPVSGPLTDTQLRAIAVPISAASLPLPSLAATSTKQSDGSQKTQVVDGSGNVIGSTSNAIDVNLKSSGASVAVTGPLTDTQLRASAVPVSGPLTDTQLRASPVAVTGGGGGVEYAEDTAHVSGDIVKMAGVVQQAADAALSNDGDRSLMQVDANGYLKVNVKASPVTTVQLATAALVSSTGYENAHVLKNAAGRLVSLQGYNSKTSTQFIQLHDRSFIPNDGTIPIMIFIVPAQSNFSFDIPLGAMPFANGIVVCNSSSAQTKTIGSADCFFTAMVI